MYGRNYGINLYKFIYIMGEEEIRKLILEWVEFTSEKNKFPSINHIHNRYIKAQVEEFIKSKSTKDDYCHYSGLPSPSFYSNEQEYNKEKDNKSSVNRDNLYDNAVEDDY